MSDLMDPTVVTNEYHLSSSTSTARSRVPLSIITNIEVLRNQKGARAINVVETFMSRPFMSRPDMYVNEIFRAYLA